MNRGFTMIELLIVLSIVAILALLAAPSVLPARGRTQVLESIQLANELKPAINSHYLIARAFPEDNKAAGLPAPNKLPGNFQTHITIEKGAMHLRLGNKAIKPLQGKTVTIRPVYVEGSPKSPVSWICGFSGIPEGMKAAAPNHTNVEPMYLPVDCRGLAVNND